MKAFLRRISLVSVLAVTTFGFISFASADVDPDKASSEDPSASGALGQYPQAEIAPVTPPPTMPFNAPPIPPSEASNASVSGSQPQASGDTGNFPKVQTSQDELMARKFAWWPTDAKPGPYKDPDRSGYWW